MKKVSLFFIAVMLCASAPSWAAETDDTKEKIIAKLDEFSDKEEFQESVGQVDDPKVLAVIWEIVQHAQPPKKKKRKRQEKPKQPVTRELNGLDYMIALNRLNDAEVEELKELNTREEKNEYLRLKIEARRSKRFNVQQEPSAHAQACDSENLGFKALHNMENDRAEKLFAEAADLYTKIGMHDKAKFLQEVIEVDC